MITTLFTKTFLKTLLQLVKKKKHILTYVVYKAPNGVFVSLFSYRYSLDNEQFDLIIQKLFIFLNIVYTIIMI